MSDIESVSSATPAMMKLRARLIAQQSYMQSENQRGSSSEYHDDWLRAESEIDGMFAAQL